MIRIVVKKDQKVFLTVANDNNTGKYYGLRKYLDMNLTTA